MKVRVLFICLCISLLLIHSEGYISVNIDPEDLDHVTELFHAIVINQQPQSIIQIPKHRVILSFIKKTICGIIQLFGVMITLVGANVISSKWVPDAPMPVQLQRQSEIFVQNQNNSNNIQLKQSEMCNQPKIIVQNQNKSNNINLKHSEMCNIDFGCNKNVCWRSCNTNVEYNGKKLWCYTSSKYRAREFQHCVDANDCSLCWECIEPCHT